MGITPRVEGEGGSGMIGNRGMEEEVAKEDLRSMGGSVMDPNRSGIEYLRADRRAELGDSDKGDTMSRMFAPSTPQDIWDMGAIQE